MKRKVLNFGKQCISKNASHKHKHLIDTDSNNKYINLVGHDKELVKNMG